MKYMNITPPYCQILNDTVHTHIHWKIMQCLSAAIISMRTLDPRETKGLGLESEMQETYKFGRSEALKTSDLSKETLSPNLNRAPSRWGTAGCV